MAEQVGDPLGRYHIPDQTAQIRAQAETGIKGQWDNIILDPDYESRRWGGGDNVKNIYLKHPETIDSEFLSDVGRFLLEKFGVGSFNELREITEAFDEDFSLFNRNIKGLLYFKREDGKRFLSKKERDLISSQLKNIDLVKINPSPSEEGSDLKPNLDTDILFNLFLEWRKEEPGLADKFVEKTNHKVQQYFGIRKMEPEKKPKPFTRRRKQVPKPKYHFALGPKALDEPSLAAVSGEVDGPQGIEAKQVARALDKARAALAKVAAEREQTEREKQEKKGRLGKILRTVPEGEHKEWLNTQENDPEIPMIFVWDLDRLKDERDKIAVENFCGVWEKMVKGVEGKKIKDWILLRINPDKEGNIGRLYLELRFNNGTKVFAYIDWRLVSEASVGGGFYEVDSNMKAERLGMILNRKDKISFTTSKQKEPVFLPKGSLYVDIASVKPKRAAIPVPATV